MSCKIRLLIPLGLVAVMSLAGCQSPPDHAEQGALFGGLLGAGTGAVVGHALGNTGAGAAIGAGVGALSGAAIGAGQDQTEARNRALIEARLGRQVAGAVTVPDAVAMAHAGIEEGVIINSDPCPRSGGPPASVRRHLLAAAGRQPKRDRGHADGPGGRSGAGRSRL